MKFSTSISMMFREFPIAQRFQAARDAGFEGVEIQVHAEGQPAEMAAAAKAADIEVALINVGMGDFLAGGAGLSGVPGREEEFHTEAVRTLRLAQLLGCRHVHVGPSRVPPGYSREACLDVLAANLERILPVADEAAIRLLVEPLNRIDTPTALLAHIDDGAALIGGRLRGRVGLQFDLYHVATNGDDPVAALQRLHALVAHVQFSDAPGRKPPGAGTIDFARFFAALVAGHYTGWVGAEYPAGADTVATLGWLPALRRAAQP
jgi:hydroxypyruvate isomerase